MTEIVIQGLAVPFYVPNSFNETLLPGTFKQLSKPLVVMPMFFNHETGIDEDQPDYFKFLIFRSGQFTELGWWTKVWESEAGIMCRGIVTTTMLSRMLLRKMDDDTKRIKGLGLSMTYYDKNRRAKRLMKGSTEDGKQRFREYTVTNTARMTEISITPEPAWSGTYIDVLGDQEQATIEKDNLMATLRSIKREKEEGSSA